MNPSIIKTMKPSLLKQMKTSTDMKLSTEELKEKTKRIAEMYKNEIGLKRE